MAKEKKVKDIFVRLSWISCLLMPKKKQKPKIDMYIVILINIKELFAVF